MSNANNIIYTPIGNADFVGGIKLKDAELTNQQFFDTIFTKYTSFTLPVYSETEFCHLEIKLYSDLNSAPIRTIDSKNNPKDRELIFGIQNGKVIEMPENGFNSSYQGNPVFVDLQEYYNKANFISWKTSLENKYFYSVFPSMNVDNYGNGKSNASGGGDGNFDYEGYFSVEDITKYDEDTINISNGVIYVENERITIPSKELKLIEYLTGYVIDVGEYSDDIFKYDFLDFGSQTQVRGEITDEKINESPFPCELRLVVSKTNGIVETYYTFNQDNREENVTDTLIATIDKNSDGTLKVIQQKFGEIDVCKSMLNNDINVEGVENIKEELSSVKEDINNINSLLKDEQNGLPSKADKTDVDSVKGGLASKADKTDVDSVKDGLASKADKTDVDSVKDGLASKADKTFVVGYPDYSNGESVAGESTYTVTKNGWIFASHRRDSAYCCLRVNGGKVFATGGSSWDRGSCFIPVRSGDKIATYSAGSSNSGQENPLVFDEMIFYPNIVASVKDTTI